MLALSGAALATVSTAQAQISTYSQDDLLLNFRNATTTSDSDVLVDLGNINTFVAAVAALPGGTAALDSGTGITPTPGYTSTFTSSGVLGVVGTPSTGNQVGFSVAGSDQTSKTIYLSRVISTGSLIPGTPSSQVSSINQGKTVNDIANIGLTGETGTALTGGALGSTAVVASGTAGSYQLEAEASTSLPAVISYGGTQGITSGNGGAIEGLQTGSGDIYEALWTVPVSGSGTPSFDGYFTFQPDGEVDFTTTPTAVPEPTTYGMLAGLGLLALAARRQFRALSV